jgi:hypothetical protein
MKIFESDEIIIEEFDTIKFSFKKGTFDKSFAAFLKKYPMLVTSSVKIGTDAISAYKTAKNATTRFLARTPWEKVIYKNIVNTLNSSGKFKLVTDRIQSGGVRFYELVHK